MHHQLLTRISFKDTADILIEGYCTLHPNTKTVAVRLNPADKEPYLIIPYDVCEFASIVFVGQVGGVLFVGTTYEKALEKMYAYCIDATAVEVAYQEESIRMYGRRYKTPVKLPIQKVLS